MSWSPTEDGFGKARVKKFQQLLQDAVPALQTCFANDANLKFLTDTRLGMTRDSVIRGSFVKIWDMKTAGYLRLYVSGGFNHMRGPAVDAKNKQFYIAGQGTQGGLQRFFAVTVLVLFHSDAFAIYQEDQRATALEDGFETILDWMDWDVFGRNENRKILIPSKCHSNNVTTDNPDGFDFMYDVKIVQDAKVQVALGAGLGHIAGVQAVITGYC